MNDQEAMKEKIAEQINKISAEIKEYNRAKDIYGMTWQLLSNALDDQHRALIECCEQNIRYWKTMFWLMAAISWIQGIATIIRLARG